MKVTLDRIASATRNARIGPEAILSSTVPAEEGTVVAVRIHGRKTTYNELEDSHGRMIRLDDGNIVAGVLGSRRALRGYAGHVPEKVEPGDRLHMLNLGGVIGKCTSVNLELGPPFEAEVLGTVLTFPFIGERRGVPATIRDNAVPWADLVGPSAPIVYVAGSCMNSGKTFACGEIIRYLSHKGLKVCGAKLTGVSLLRDILSMQDRGAFKCLSFNDAGVVSTTEKVSVPVARGLLNALNQEKPDCLVVELGDGILGEYGVQAILDDDGLMAPARIHVLCASDPVAAWGCAELYKTRFNRPIGVISGAATDNQVGKDFIEKHIGVRAINARLEYEEIGRHVERALFGSRKG